MPNDEVKSFIDKLAANDNVGAGDAFKDALRSKVGDALDARRQEVAGSMFKAKPHSDPKPEIADPGVFNPDGSISPTPTDAESKDGKAELELAPKAEVDNADKQDS